MPNPSHVFVVGSAGSGKTYSMLHEYKRMVFITFVRYSSFANHCISMKEKGIDFGVVIADRLAPLVLPHKEVIILDMSKFRNIVGETPAERMKMAQDREMFLIDLIRKNKNYYTTFAIDEAQIIFPASTQTARTQHFLDFLSTSRNEGIRIILASQRPQSVSSSAVGLMRAFVCMRVNDKNGIKAIDEALQQLGTGDYVQQNQTLTQVGMRKNYVFS